MKMNRLLLLALLWLQTTAIHAATLDDLSNKRWYSGSADCSKDQAPAIETYRYNRDTFILRQNKCDHFEAPFIYLLIGQQQALLLDTGALKSPADFPLYDTVQKLLKGHPQQVKSLVVAHSHAHSDHTAADSQFDGKAGVTLVEADLQSVQIFFKLNENQDHSHFDLGKRKLTVIATPGHHQTAITIYDPNTGWLLTGDSIYPGRLYVCDWQAFKASVAKLQRFSQQHPVTAIMGTHIEMSNQPGKDYPSGSTWQPHEASLVLLPEELSKLHRSLLTVGDIPTRQALDKMIIFPLK